MTEFSSLQILQSGCNPRHLNSRAFLDCSGLHLDYMDYKVIKWIAEQYNPKQSKGNLCNPSAIHCNLGLQFCFAIQINLCNLTAIQEDCSLIAEIALWLWRLHTDCWDCNMIADIAHWLLRLQIFRNLHIRLVIPPRVGEVAWELPQGNGTRMIEWVRMQELLSDCWYFALIAYWLLRLQSNCWDCCLIAEIAVWLWRLKLDCWDCKVSATCVI